VLYLDTSAFLKILVEEEHSLALRAALTDRDIWSSSLLAVEAHRSALRLGIDSEAVDQRLAAVTLIAPSESSYFSARTIGTHMLRTLDALHLASALELGADLEALATYDRRLAEACDQLDIEVLSPGSAARWWATS
jgi:uncharacterized protein